MPRPVASHLPTGYRRPWALARQAAKELAKDQKHMHFGKDGFSAHVDVHHFSVSLESILSIVHLIQSIFFLAK